MTLTRLAFFRLLGSILIAVLLGVMCWTAYQRHVLLQRLLQHKEQSQ